MGVISDANSGGYYHHSDKDERPFQVEGPPTRIDGDDPIADAFNVLQNVAKQHTKHVEDVLGLEKADQASGAPQLTADGVQALLTKFADTPAAKQVGTAMAAVDVHVAEAEQHAEQVRESLRAGDDAAAQTKAQRTWARTARILDAANDGTVVGVAKKILDNASPAEVLTLAEEIGPALQARGVPTEWIDEALAQAVPELGQANDRVRQLRKQKAVLDFNEGMSRRSITTGQRIRVPLVDPLGLNAKPYK